MNQPFARIGYLCLLLAILIAPANGDGLMPAFLKPSQRAYRIVKVKKPPRLNQTSPLKDRAWQKAELMGQLFFMGQPEPENRKTEIRILYCRKKLYVAAQCFDPQPDKIVAFDNNKDLWKGDALELFFTQTDRPEWPYVQLQINPKGHCSVTRYTRPFHQSSTYMQEEMDHKEVQLNSGISKTGWWTVMAIPMDRFELPESGLYANVIRDRPADASYYSWIDLEDGSAHAPHIFGQMTLARKKPRATPYLETPAPISVGVNHLTFANWQNRYKVLANEKTLPVTPSGKALLTIKNRGPVLIELLNSKGMAVESYSAAVKRPLIINVSETFQNDLTKPISIQLSLDVAGNQPIEVHVQGTIKGKIIGETRTKVKPGVHTIALECKGQKRGEVQVTANAILPASKGPAITISARHWCTRGIKLEDIDKFRNGIDALPMLSRFRAGVADAANAFRLIQAGDGRYREWNSSGKAVLGDLNGSIDHNWGIVYCAAMLYKTNWAENPYKGDPRFLHCAIAGMEAGLDPRTKYPSGGFSRYLQNYLLVYDLLKDDVSPDMAKYWRMRLVKLVEHVIRTIIEPASFLYAFHNEYLESSVNHYSCNLSDIYTAGWVLNRKDWLKLGANMMRTFAAKNENGCFPERRGMPAAHYNWLTMNGVGLYAFQSEDEDVMRHLGKCVEFCSHVTLPDGNNLLLHDGRNNSPHPWNAYGNFVMSLTPIGRHVVRIRVANHISTKNRPSKSSPAYWARATENAIHYKQGEEKDMPENAELTFFNGRGLMARRKGFIYGLSALCLLPVEYPRQTDAQNAIELHHKTAGPILHGANSAKQPEAGSFLRMVDGKASYLPIEGAIERTLSGHMAQLHFKTFRARVNCDVLSKSNVRVKVALLEAKGDEPVVYSFYPGVKDEKELTISKNKRELNFRKVKIESNYKVQLEKGFRIINPYGQRRTNDTKPVRAIVNLKLHQPLVLNIRISDTK